MIELNAEFQHEFQYSQADVELFAKVTGDNNPVHLDAAYAATTMFKKPIMHGMLSAGIFSKVLGTMFPGEGTIYLSQSLAFKRPMYVDTPYVAIFKAIDVNKEKHRATIQTQVIDKATGDITVEGEAKVMNLTKI
jgi:acyl dehydratase